MSIEGIAPASLPADVRNGSEKQKQAYTAALGFERMLLEQLTKPLAQSAMSGNGDTADSGTEDSGSGDSGSAVYGDLISSSMADSVSQQGGLGLADSLYRSFGMEGK
jgi:Rod binding domain-containing protein